MTVKNGGAALSLALLVAAVSPGGARAEERYWITEVPTTDSQWVTARRMNAAGDVAGTVWVAPDGYTTYAFLYSFPRRTLTRLETAAGPCGSAEDLNDLGHVLASCPGGAVVYQAGVYHDLAAAGLYNAYDLGPAGHVAGSALDATGSWWRASVWYAGAVTSLHDALAPLGAISSEAVFVNGKGEVVGTYYDDGSTLKTFFYSNGVARALPFESFITSEDGRFGPLNENSMVAGYFTDEYGLRHLATWWEGMVIDLGTGLPGDYHWSQVRGMNDRNDIFGYTYADQPSLAHVFRFTWEDQALLDLPSFGGSMCVHGINNRGELAGHGNLPGDAPYLGEYGPGPNYVFTGGELVDVNEAVAPGSGLVFSAYDGVINDAGQLLIPASRVTDGQVPVVLTPFPASALTLSGSLRADGWYTGNVSPRLTAAALPGIRELRYRVDDGPWTVVAGDAADLPNIRQQGTHRVEYQAVDALGHVEALRTARVSIDKGGPVVRTRSLRFGTVGVAYAVAVTASGGTGPYAFQLAAGALPPGLSLRADGRISGVPAQAGRFELELRVTDARKASSRSFLALEILEPLRVTTPALVDGTGGNVALLAAGGKAPYTWTVDPATPAPAGFTVEFATLLTPWGNLDPATFRVVVTDAYGQVARTELTAGVAPITVFLYPPATTTYAPGEEIGLQLGASGGTGVTTGYAFGVVDALPPGTSFQGWGWLSGAVAEPGTYTFSVVAWDGTGNESQPFPVTIVVQ